MSVCLQRKERKLVPRFRRRHARTNLVDIDDEEAQALIEKELQSDFVWNSDTNVDLQYQVDTCIDETSCQQISLVDNETSNSSYDVENRIEQVWKTNIEEEDSPSVQWIDENQAYEISFSLKSGQDNKQNWTLNDNSQVATKLNLVNLSSKQQKFDLDEYPNRSIQIFIHGDDFRNKVKYDTERVSEAINTFIRDDTDVSRIVFDLNNYSMNFNLSLPQKPILRYWLEGIAQYHLSLPSEKFSSEISPLAVYTPQYDSIHLKSLKWTLDVLKQNLIHSYTVALPDDDKQIYSLDDKSSDHTISILEDHYKPIFSLTDFSFQQILSLTSNDFKQQLLSIIDSWELQRDFGKGDRCDLFNISLETLRTIIVNYSPEEPLNINYSPNDASEILLEHLLIASDEISARAFRRYRCKHVSCRIDENNSLDCLENIQLRFRGNELIAIGEEIINNDVNEQQIFRDTANNKILLDSTISQSYDVASTDHLVNRTGSCLYRSDYECEPPKTWTRLRREIGYISFDASLAQPNYYLDKSYKRFVHIPQLRDDCSYNVYRGYNEFIEKGRLNPENYFRPFDSTDLRPLLHWYSQKQYLFSSTNKQMLKPPTFICRRLVLRTILANLYCDSEPWKLLVIRVKGQFYLALANKKTKSIEDMTEDEYSGYKFEALFTTDQPNSTRLQEKIPLENPQRQFHTVQYWQFGEFNLLYSNEIDGEMKIDPEENSPIDENTTRQEESSISKQMPTDTSQKSNDVDWWQNEIPMNIETVLTEEKETSKEMQITENLQITTSEENETVEKKKRNEPELKSGYVEMKCTNKKIFYKDENKLQTLTWWAQMWLANINTLMIGYKASSEGLVKHIDMLSIDKLIWKFLSRYDLRLKYCLSYLYSFLKLVQTTVLIDDPNTIHAFAYIPQPLEIDSITGRPCEYDLPKCVPFRYTQMKRSNQRHSNFMPHWYIEFVQRATPTGGSLQDKQLKTVEQETQKRIGHRGRASCVLKREQQQKKRRRGHQ